MACYDIESYTFKIDNEGVLKIIDRQTQNEGDEFNLGESNLKISKSGSDFCIVGTGDITDPFVSSTDLEDNEVTLPVSFEIMHIGGSSGESIDLRDKIAFIELDQDTLKFYEEDI